LIGDAESKNEAGTGRLNVKSGTSPNAESVLQ
jgi:hypothetical protein